ncbi:MAG: HlyD family efflux transporter periplasmic adaptor subunit [Acidobacteriota bacterium]|jgi:membrane fusion protein|nr:HlyD family efflux transporter periplasmic adaptor subunit [Acidobacteriota bacterium]
MTNSVDFADSPVKTPVKQKKQAHVLPLFRKEAVDHQRERLCGELILAQPISYWAITVFLVAVTSIACWFLAANSYARKEKVPGIIVPREGIVTVYPPQAGILAELNVSEGMSVEESAVLFSMLTDQRMTGGEYVGLKLIEQLDVQEIYLNRKLAYEQERAVAALEANETKANRLRKEIEQLQRLIRTQNEALEISRGAYERMQKLSSENVISQIELEEYYKKYLEQKQQSDSLAMRMDEAVSSMEETALNVKTLKVGSKREIADIENQLAELAKQRTQISGQRQMVVSAPVAGRITAVTVSVGQKIDAARPLFSIIPNNSDLQADLYLPTRSIGFLETGQSINIGYEAFPYQKFGTYPGKISQVAGSVIMPGEPASGLTFQEPVYKVTAALESQHVQAYGKEIPLRPGMTLSADVVLDKRSLFEWLLEPVYSLRGKI